MTFSDFDGLGWSSHFAAQVAPDAQIARISAVHRDAAQAFAPQPLRLRVPMGTSQIAVGDWVTHDGHSVTRILERRTEIARGAVGEARARQLIAANVDTLAITTSCNADFNVARLERYLALAATAGCLPLIVLTKSDQHADPGALVRQAQALSPLVTALALDARTEADRLAPWCRDGQTLALIGSSGVGKTTLQNGLTGSDEATQGIREDDAKGHHTTTARFLRPTLAGGWLIDTPGMRELRLAGAETGIEEVFSEITDLAAQCRFRDCAHEGEPGCAVQAAVDAGELAPERVARWRKLERENRHATESLAQTRARHKAFTKRVKSHQNKDKF